MPYEESVEKLQAFCGLLQLTNPALESGGADLQHAAQALGDADAKLAQDLDSLAHELDDVQKAAEASSLEAEKACRELDDAVQEVNTAALAELEKGAEAVAAHWAAALNEQASGLDSAFAELESSGWEPLVAALNAEDVDFINWTHGGEDVLTSVAHVFATAAGEAQQGASDAVEAARELDRTEALWPAFWQQPQSEAEKVTEQTVPWFRAAELEASKELGAASDELAAAAADDSGHVRAQTELTTHTTAEAIDGEAGEVAQVVQQTAGALERVEVEFERSAVQADRAEAEARKLAELAGQVAEAGVKLQKVHAATEAMHE